MIVCDKSPMSHSLSETDSGSYLEQSLKSSPPTTCKTSQHDLVAPSVDRSLKNNNTMIVSSLSGSLMPDQEKKMLKNSIDEPFRSQIRKKSRPASNFSKMVQQDNSTEPPTDVLSFSVRKKSTRARPDNPLKYKTLRRAKIRSGKSVRTEGVRNLQKGVVVVINQIKGRSGRVVELQPNGEFMKVGWVTLYTHDRKQLLEKLNPQTNSFDNEKMISQIL